MNSCLDFVTLCDLIVSPDCSDRSLRAAPDYSCLPHRPTWDKDYSLLICISTAVFGMICTGYRGLSLIFWKGSNYSNTSSRSQCVSYAISMHSLSMKLVSIVSDDHLFQPSHGKSYKVWPFLAQIWNLLDTLYPSGETCRLKRWFWSVANVRYRSLHNI